MSCSPVVPGTTATSSQPSSPLLARICLVAWTISGTLTYSHLVMALTLALGGIHLFARQAFALADTLPGGELRRAAGSGSLHLRHLRHLRHLGHLGHGRRAELRRARVRDRRLGGGHLCVAQV